MNYTQNLMEMYSTSGDPRSQRIKVKSDIRPPKYTLRVTDRVKQIDTEKSTKHDAAMDRLRKMMADADAARGLVAKNESYMSYLLRRFFE